jgi:hypothetical protein
VILVSVRDDQEVHAEGRRVPEDRRELRGNRVVALRAAVVAGVSAVDEDPGLPELEENAVPVLLQADVEEVNTH